MATPRIALVHAVTVAVDPIRDAFTQLWPQAAVVNILDDSLSPDRARDADLTPEMSARIGALGDYALSTGCSGVLYTCSAFGEAIEAFAKRAPVPVLKPNEAMFEAALSIGARIGMLATFGPSVAGMEAEFLDQARALRRQASIKTVLVETAMTALKSGDADAHNRLLAEAVPELGEVDVVMLAHFSTSRAFAAVSEKTTSPVLTSPRSAVEAMRRMCAAREVGR
jgi:hypothetical protein